MLSKPVQRVFPLAFIAALAACSGGANTPSQMLPTSVGAPAAANEALSVQSSPSSSRQTLSAQSTTTTAPYTTAILNDKPVAFYPLDDSAPTAHDQSGNNLTGTIGSSVKEGAAGLATATQSMTFPGTESSAGDISVPSTTKLQPSANVSLESLFRFTTSPADYTVLAGYGQRSGVASYELYFKGNTLIAQFTLSSGYVTVASSTLAVNTTYHAVATYDGSTAKLYLNGKLVASSAKTGTLKYVNGYGLSIADDASNSNPAFNGTIGGVAVFPSTLSATQVSAHYAAVSTSPATPTPSPTPTTTPTPVPTATPTPKPTATPTPVPTASPAGTVLWKAGDASLGKWVTANTYQCGTPQNTGTTFTFNFSQSGTSCGRNQANPVTSSGSLITLNDDSTYTWSFHYIDGKPDGTGPGMADTGSDPEALIWQIHGLNEGDTPCTSLNFVNGSYYSGSLGAGQQWALMTCAGPVWYGKYTPGEQDDFKIVATVANADIASETYGETKLYRNGVLVADAKGPNYHHSTSSPAQAWWNFGPYKWRWELANSGTNTKTVNATINNLTLTKN